MELLERVGEESSKFDNLEHGPKSGDTDISLNTEKVKKGKKPLSCVVCGETKNIQFCAGCQSVGYCSVSHQKSNWKKHQPICLASRKFPFEFISDDNDEERLSGGKYSQKRPIACRDLDPGEVIVEELPLFSYIFYTLSLRSKSNNSKKKTTTTVYCVTCGVSVGTHTLSNQKRTETMQNPKQDSKLEKYACEICAWPVCSTDCAKNPLHAENECKLFSEISVQPGLEMFNHNDASSLNGFWSLVATARIYTISLNKPETWQEILEFVPKGKASSQLCNNLMSDKMNNVQSSAGRLIPKFFRNTREGHKVLHEIFTQITNMSRHIGFGKPVTSSTCSNHWSHFVYKHASHFPHACAANCTMVIGPSPDSRIRIRAAVKIKKGQSLYLNLLGPSIVFRGTAIRQRMFYDRFQRFCTCSLCVDPTELGTYQSAITCPKCFRNKKLDEASEEVAEFGCVIPNFPTPFAGNFEFGTDTKILANRHSENGKPVKEPFEYWKCVDCSHIVNPRMRLDIEHKIKERYDLLLEYETFGHINGHYSPAIVNYMEKLQDERKSLLSPNHWVFQFGIFLYCKSRLKATNMPHTALDSLFNMYAYLISTLDVTCPGLQLERIAVVHHFGADIVKQSVVPMSLTKKSTENTDKLIRCLEMAKGYLAEACLFWNGQISPEKADNLGHCSHFYKLAYGFVEVLRERKLSQTETSNDEEEDPLTDMENMERELLQFSEAERE